MNDLKLLMNVFSVINPDYLEIAVAIDDSAIHGPAGIKKIGNFLNFIVDWIRSSYKNYRLILLRFDAVIRNPKIYTPENIDDIKNQSDWLYSGGTLYSSIFDYLKSEKIKPDCLIIFSDGFTVDWGDPNYCETIFVLSDSWAQCVQTIPYGYLVEFEENED